jgi:hypothetical protein
MLALALHNYADTHPIQRGASSSIPAFPAGTVENPALPADQRLSWVVEVLPYVEQESLAGSIDRTRAWDTAALRSPIATFQCADLDRESPPNPADATPYIGMAGLGSDAPLLHVADRRSGVFGYERRTAHADITDGMSNTLLILESARDNGPWGRGGSSTVRGMDPADVPHLGSGRQFGGTHFSENTLFSRRKSNGCNAALSDGSVRFLAESIHPHVLQALATVAGGEDAGNDW